MLRLWGLSLGMTLDLLAHLPSASTSPRIWENGESGEHGSEERSLLSESRREPKTPVTVTSSFDEKWDAARKALDRERAASASAGSTPASASTSTVVSPNGHGSLGLITPMTSSNAGRNPTTDAVDNDNGRSNGHGNGGNGQQIAMAGQSGAGLTRFASLGKRIDAKTYKGKKRGVGPGVTAVFPRFSYPDVNFWIWVFGRRYRRVVQGWEASVTGKGRASDRR